MIERVQWSVESLRFLQDMKSLRFTEDETSGYRRKIMREIERKIMLFGTGFATYYQGAMPAAWMGRVGNLTTPATQSATAIMTVLAGVAAQIVGVRVMTVTATSVLLLVGLLAFVTIFLRSVRMEFGRHTAGVASMTGGAPGGTAAGNAD